MPIYEYKCTGCGAHIEKLQKASDEPLTSCESCGGELEKQWSLSGFQFKGEGWYVTDYAKDKNGGSSPPAKKEKSKESESTDKTKSASKEKSKKPEKKPKEQKSKD